MGVPIRKPEEPRREDSLPDPHEKTAIQDGWYANWTREVRKARRLPASGESGPPAAEVDRAPLTIRRTWARLIRKSDEVDPCRCPRCGATMKASAVIEEEEVSYRILSHLHRLSQGDGPRAPPKRAGLRELFDEPVFDDLSWMTPISLFTPGAPGRMKIARRRRARRRSVLYAYIFVLAASLVAESPPGE